MLTNFHRWYDRIPEPWRLLSCLFGVAFPFIVAVNALGLLYTINHPVFTLVCLAVVGWTLVLTLSRVAYLKR